MQRLSTRSILQHHGEHVLHRLPLRPILQRHGVYNLHCLPSGHVFVVGWECDSVLGLQCRSIQSGRYGVLHRLPLRYVLQRHGVHHLHCLPSWHVFVVGWRCDYVLGLRWRPVQRGWYGVMHPLSAR